MEEKPSPVTTTESNIAAIKNLIDKLIELGLPVKLGTNGTFSISNGAPSINAIVNKDRSEVTISGTWAIDGKNHGNVVAHHSFASLGTPEGVKQAVWLITTFLKLSTPATESESE